MNKRKKSEKCEKICKLCNVKQESGKKCNFCNAPLYRNCEACGLLASLSNYATHLKHFCKSSTNPQFKIQKKAVLILKDGGVEEIIRTSEQRPISSLKKS